METRPAQEHASVDVRPLAPSDLDAVVALDRRIVGGWRRGYFDRRLAAALRQPRRHLQLAALGPSGMTGFLLARVADGEYGRPGAAGVIEAVGVEPASQRSGVGQRMLRALDARLHDRGIGALVTQADWRDRSMLGFLDRAGFALAQRHILERRVHRMPLPETDEEIERAPPLVRHLRAGDVDMLLRIDRALTGADREAYLRRKVDEALNESAISVSLVVEDDGFVVGYATARVDLGDFGHVQPTASLDTFGVSPGFARRGFARALLGQMVDNLAALHVESLETEVESGAFELARFLYRFGFVISQRMAFERGTRRSTGAT